MRFGDTYGAVSALESVKQVRCEVTHLRPTQATTRHDGHKFSSVPPLVRLG